jgi:hypothetical protein
VSSPRHAAVALSSQWFEFHPEVNQAVAAAGPTTGDDAVREIIRIKEKCIEELVKRELQQKADEFAANEREGRVPSSPLCLVMDEMTLGMAQPRVRVTCCHPFYYHRRRRRCLHVHYDASRCTCVVV